MGLGVIRYSMLSTSTDIHNFALKV